MKKPKDVAYDIHTKAVIKAFKAGWNACVDATIETLPNKMKV